MSYLPRFQELIQFFHRYVGGRIFLVLFLIACAGISESLGLIMVLPLLSEESARYIPSFIATALPTKGSGLFFLAIFLTIGIFFAFKGVLVYVAYSFLGHVKQVLFSSAKSEILESYAAADYKSISTINPSEFINNVGEQSNRLAMSADAFVGFFSHVILSTIYIVVAFYLAPIFGLLALIGGILIAVLFKVISQKGLEVSSKIVSATEDFNASVIESVMAQKYLRCTGLLGRINKTQLNKIEALAKLEKSKASLVAILNAVREPLAVMMVLAIIAFQVFVLEGEIEPILISIIMFHRATSAVLQSQSSWHGLMDTFGSVASVKAIQNSLESNFHNSITASAVKDRPDILFSQVAFSYSQDQQPPTVLDISFELPFGNVLAIVGGSGAGKTTIADLITGLYGPSEGVIKIGGDILNGSIISSWQKSVGYVAQDSTVFDGSISENITMCFGSERPMSTDLTKINDILRTVGLLDFVESLPDGLNTKLSALISILSGGQRQRLCIARELFRSPKLLIMDEATSALDPETEQVINDTIDHLKGEMSVVVIAHRLSTVKNADNIIVLESGRIVESGNYQNLIGNMDSNFYRFAAMQGLV